MIPSMISSGPTTENAPSPAERLHVPSLAKIGEFLGARRQSLAENEDRLKTGRRWSEPLPEVRGEGFERAHSRGWRF
jgi:hypothetical protein